MDQPAAPPQARLQQAQQQVSNLKSEAARLHQLADQTEESVRALRHYARLHEREAAQLEGQFPSLYSEIAREESAAAAEEARAEVERRQAEEIEQLKAEAEAHRAELDALRTAEAGDVSGNAPQDEAEAPDNVTSILDHRLEVAVE